jgi:hypothetical protein
MASTLRLRAFIVGLIVIPITFALKYYDGPCEWWLNNWGSSVGYEVFFMLLAFVMVPRRSAITQIAVWVCVITCALEFMQLWHPAWLRSIRSTFIGRGLLGTTFQWWDLPAYPVGCAVGWLLLHVTSRSIAPLPKSVDATTVGPPSERFI